MKKLLLVALAVILPIMAWGVLPKGDTDDANMPIYYYTGPDTVNVIPDGPQGERSWAERSLYEYEEEYYDPITMGFNNRVNILPIGGSLLQVELSDQLLEWFVYIGPHWIEDDTKRILAGSRVDNNTGITLAVYSANYPNGAEIRFSGAENLLGARTGDRLPTFYSFQDTPTIPNQAALISAENLNSYVIPVPYEQEKTWYLWSAVDVKKRTKIDQYRNNFDIIVQNIP